jgi:hypothetical protein
MEPRGISVLPKAKITVLNSSKTGIRAMYNDDLYVTKLLKERPKISAPKGKAITKERVHTKPPAEHPWRKTPIKRPKLYYEETDSEILEMLDELFSSTRAWA